MPKKRYLFESFIIRKKIQLEPNSQWKNRKLIHKFTYFKHFVSAPPWKYTVKLSNSPSPIGSLKHIIQPLYGAHYNLPPNYVFIKSPKGHNRHALHKHTKIVQLTELKKASPPFLRIIRNEHCGFAQLTKNNCSAQLNTSDTPKLGFRMRKLHKSIW